MGFTGFPSMQTVQQLTNADIRKTAGLAGLSDGVALDIKQGCYFFLELCAALGEFFADSRDEWAVATEYIFFVFGQRGLTTFKDVGKTKDEVKRYLMGALMKEVEARGNDYRAAIQARITKAVFPFIGRTSPPTVISPIHLIAQSMRQEYGISFKDVEEKLRIRGKLTGYSIDEVAGGWFREYEMWYSSFFCGLRSE